MTAAGAGAAEVRPSLAEALSDRINPILVKEVRQALRGRTFVFAFLGTLLVATAVTMAVLFDAPVEAEELGGALFTPMLVCLTLTTFCVVPFHAFVMMGAEWSENTYDLLILSHLGPRRIILGKWVSSITQIALYYSAFGPFLVFAFLLRGVDPLDVLIALGVVGATSSVLSLVALALSSVGRQRAVRISMLVSLALIVFLSVMMLLQLSFLARGGFFRMSLNWNALGGVLVVLSVVAAYSFETAAARLDSPEESYSTGLRVLTGALLIPLWAWMEYLATLAASPTSARDLSEACWVGATVLQFLLVLPLSAFATEQEFLGRRAWRLVPGSRIRAWLSVPFLPGGGRGLLLYGLLSTVLLVAVLSVAPRHGIAMSVFLGHGPLGFLAAMLFGWVWLGTPSFFLRRPHKTMRAVAAGRAGVMSFALALALLPIMFGFFAANRDLQYGKHLGNPIYVMDKAWEAPNMPDSLVGLAMVSALVFLLNSKRLVQSVRVVFAVADRNRRFARAAREGSAGDSRAGPDA